MIKKDSWDKIDHRDFLKKPENVFVFIVIFVGLFIAIFTPPMCIPDENTHFFLSYNVANGNFFPRIEDGNLGYDADVNIYTFIENNNSIAYGRQYSFEELYVNSWLPRQTPVIEFYGYRHSYNFVPYIFSAIGINMGRILVNLAGYSVMNSPNNLMIYARLGNLVFYIITIYFAIKITPFFKRTMLIMSLMPMAIFLGASSNYDGVLIPVAFMFFALLFKLVSEKDTPISKADIALVMALVFFIGAVKTVCLPFVLLLFFVPFKKFGTAKKYISCIIGAGLCTGMGYFLFNLNAMMTKDIIATNELIIQQNEYVRNNLLKMPEMILNTINFSKGFWIEGYYGKLGVLDLNFPFPLFILFYMILIAVFFIDVFSAVKVKWSMRAYTVFAIVVCICALVFEMYKGWTPLVAEVGGNYSTGVQGRYFIPVMIFTGFIFSNGLLSKFKCNQAVVGISEKLTVGFLLIYPFSTIVLILLKYYTK